MKIEHGKTIAVSPFHIGQNPPVAELVHSVFGRCDMFRHANTPLEFQPSP